MIIEAIKKLQKTSEIFIKFDRVATNVGSNLGINLLVGRING